MAKTKKYKILSDVEHVLLRPTMYIGNIKTTPITTYLYDLNSFFVKSFHLNTFLYKLFDEIITNAIDEFKRGAVTEIRVSIEKMGEDLKIEVLDNGGIEVEYFEDTGKYIPEILFSQLRSSSNFGDYQDELVGTFGVGATLVNIFSKYFEVHTSKGGKSFLGIWKDNMSVYEGPYVEKSNKNFTKITFIPDLKRFELAYTEEDLYFLYRRVADYSMFIPELVIYVNGIKLSGLSYSNIAPIDYQSETKNYKLILFDPTAIQLQESFVNFNLTIDKGHHVDYLLDVLTNKFQKFQKALIKNNISYLFNINTKDILFSAQDKFKYIGSAKPNLYLDSKDLLETKTYHYLKSLSDRKEITKDKKISHVNFVPPPSRENSILFITEGLSASLAGKSLKRSNMGFFSLKGKCPNTLERNPNKELRQLYTIIKEYNFSKICVMTDQDHDGDSIAALLFLFIFMYLKEFLDRIYKFKAPLVIVDKKIYFKSVEEFETYTKPYKEVKYCKGLGSYSNEDFRVFFSDIDNYIEEVKFDEESEQLFHLLFSKSNPKWRKEWLLQ